MLLSETQRVDPVRLRGWLRNVGTSYADLAVGGLLYVVLTPIFLGRLGAEAYAIWILSHTITFYLGFLDLGFGHAQVRFHARFAARRRLRAVRTLIGTTLTLLAAAGVIAAALAVAIALSPASGWLDIPSVLADELRLVLLVVGLNLLLSFPASALDEIYPGVQRFDLQNLRSIVLRLLAAGAQLTLLHQGYGLVALALVELAVTVTQLAIDLVLVKRLVPGLYGRQTRFRAAMWRRIRPFALWTMLDDLLVDGTAYLDRFLVLLLLPVALLSPYVITVTLAGLLLLAVRPLAETFFPLASELHARRRGDALVRMTRAGTRASAALAAPLAVFLVCFGDAVLTFWVPEIAGEATPALVALIALNTLVSVILWTPGTVLLALGGYRRLAALTVAEILLALALMLVLVPAYGLIGLAAALLAANAAVGFGLLLPAVARALDRPGHALLGPALGRVLAAALPAAAAALALRVTIPEPGLAGLAAAALAIGIVYGAALLAFGLDSAERERVLAPVRGALRRAVAQPAGPQARAASAGRGRKPG